MNQLGDCFSKKVSLDVLDSAAKGHDKEIRRVKREVESLYLGEMAGATPRRRRAMATRLDIRGGCHFGDNVGIVSTYQPNLYLPEPVLVPDASCSPETSPETQHGPHELQHVPEHDNQYFQGEPGAHGPPQVP